MNPSAFEAAIPIPRDVLHAREAAFLHPLALCAGQSHGRRFPEADHPYRTAFQRDRDRILHSAAFRRLQYKTQVFHNLQGGEFRTRLTHTLEVAQTARVIALSLGFNTDLVETIAYAHDVGHPPLGHAGEAVLNRLMGEFAGLIFNHNAQALRIVDGLETRYPDFPGLNLTFETRAGLLKHGLVYADCSPPDADALLGVAGRNGSYEARIVDLADELAYLCHDFEDALTAGILSVQRLDDVALIKRLRAAKRADYRALPSGHLPFLLIRDLKDFVVSDLIAEAARAIAAKAPPSAVDIGPSMRQWVDAAHVFLSRHFYSHERVASVNREMVAQLEALFVDLIRHPEHLPPIFVEPPADADNAGPILHARRVADYLSSLTDRGLTAVHREFTARYDVSHS